MIGAEKIIGSIQLGKSGYTPGVLMAIGTYFKTHDNLKLSVLKSCCRDRAELEEIAKKIQSDLGEKYTYRIIGWSIFIKKWRKARK